MSRGLLEWKMMITNYIRQNTIVVGNMDLGNVMVEMNDEDENLELFHTTKNVL